MIGANFGQQCRGAFKKVQTSLLTGLAVVLRHLGGGGDGRDGGGNARLGEAGIGGRVAVELLVFEGGNFIFVFDEDGVVLASEGAA